MIESILIVNTDNNKAQKQVLQTENYYSHMYI